MATMATPKLTKHTLAGALGEILVDVRVAQPDQSVPAIVLVHGFKGFKDWGFFPPLAERLARAGFAAVSYNASGSGVDDTGQFTRVELFSRNTFSAEVSDLRTVLEAIDRGSLGLARPSSLGIVGHSRGGGIAVLVAAEAQRVGALVTWAAIAHIRRWPEETVRRWRAQGSVDIVNQRTGEVLPLFTDILDDVEHNEAALNILNRAAGIEVPWLIVHGDRDETVDLSEGRALAQAAPRARFEIIEGAGHTFGAVHPFVGRSPTLDRVFDLTVTFLATHLS
jgi:pimeloyl-ACP methyl ester carboxylesterase